MDRVAMKSLFAFLLCSISGSAYAQTAPATIFPSFTCTGGSGTVYNCVQKFGTVSGTAIALNTGSTAPTQSAGDTTTDIANDLFVSNALAVLAPSGIVSVAHGGNGTATPSLVAGSGISITGSWPNQTITNSGGGSSFQNLTFSSSVTENVTAGNLASLTVTAAFTFNCPTGMTAGGQYQTRFVQGSSTQGAITWPSCFTFPGGSGPLSTAAGAIDIVTYSSFDGSTAQATLSRNFH